jgi:PIN domain nuclease of toxin-antitoxin system
LRLLLDSHILVWWPSGSPRLGTRAQELIEAPDSELFMSAASWWELAIKSSLGRLKIDFPATRDAMERRGTAVLPVLLNHAEKAATLNKLHGDPFDHMLVAQAIAEDLVLLTRAASLEAYGSHVLCV